MAFQPGTLHRRVLPVTFGLDPISTYFQFPSLNKLVGGGFGVLWP